MDIKKPNDIFATTLITPDVNVYDLAHSEFSADNTSLFSKGEYKAEDFVQKAFTNESGEFDDLAFNAAYKRATDLYTDMSNSEHLINNLEWDAYDFMRPIDTESKLQSIEITRDKNPYKNLYGRSQLDSVDLGELSIRELAQKSKIFDTETGKETDQSANDYGLFGSLFGETLVYAQYEEDGTHLDSFSKRDVSHKKGEYKLNEKGEFFTELLGDREIYGKQIVNPADLITVDGSTFNKIDYFDSDGRDKSIAGTTFKVVTEMAPLLIPGFNVWYGGYKAAVGLAGVLPTFYKSFESILLGETTTEKETALWKAASKAEGFMAKYNQASYSDAASKSMVNFEQLSGLVSDIFSQIYEQRAIASLSKIFYKVNDADYVAKLTGIANKQLQSSEGAILKTLIKSGKKGKAAEDLAESIGKAAADKIPGMVQNTAARSRLSKSFSLGYMALTSTGEVYEAAIEGGYDRRTAGIAALMSAGGMYTLMMNNRMGDWFLDKSVGYDLQSNKTAIKRIAKETLKGFQKGVKAMDINKKVGKETLATAIVKMKQKISNLLTDGPASGEVAEQMWKNSVVEGIEEVTEQVVMDATKGIIDTLS